MAQYVWNPLPNAPRSWRIDDFYFLNPQEGWAINPDYSYLTPRQLARVMHTTDGGQSWETLLDSSETFIRSVGFADAQTGWFGNLGEITTDTNFLYATVDGGHTWSPVNNVVGPRPKGICGISVVTDSVTYAYGRYSSPGIILKTTDKGTSWVSQSLDSLADALVDGWFFGPDTGFVIGAIGMPRQAVVIGTVDGGASWQLQHAGSRLDEIGWKIFFPSRQVGYVAVEGNLDHVGVPPDTTWIFKTTDGGQTWVEKPMRTNGFYYLQGIGFINDSVGWVGGDCCNPVCFKTQDGGDSWQQEFGLGVPTPPYSSFGGYSINRFRKFGDSLMYCSGNTVYKLQEGVTGLSDPKPLIDVLYPNPSVGEHVLHFKAPLGSDAMLVICDMRGVVAMPPMPLQEGCKHVEIPHLPPGVYVYRLLGGAMQLGGGKLILLD
jgi:photosystem II stability/assembly factor-like uncharacterized protein